MAEEFFSVREVSESLGVPPHVLRYWEREFPEFAPFHDDAGRLYYRERDVEIAARLKELLYDERSTIAAAKKRLADEYQ
jgi:DNA-binding transcriptional MerR regulator